MARKNTVEWFNETRDWINGRSSKSVDLNGLRLFIARNAASNGVGEEEMGLNFVQTKKRALILLEELQAAAEQRAAKRKAKATPAPTETSETTVESQVQTVTTETSQVQTVVVEETSPDRIELKQLPEEAVQFVQGTAEGNSEAAEPAEGPTPVVILTPSTVVPEVNKPSLWKKFVTWFNSK